MNRQQRRAAGARNHTAPNSGAEAQKDRTHFLERNLEAALLAWREAGASAEHAVLVADARGPLGKPLARDRDFGPVVARGEIPTVILAAPRVGLATELREMNPGIAHRLAAGPAPAGHVYVIAATSGGATLAAVPATGLGPTGDA